MTQALLDKIDNGEVVNNQEIFDLKGLSYNRYDTIPIDSTFILKAFDEFSQTGNKEVFKISLLLFHSDFINSTIRIFNSYFQKVDYLKPIPIGSRFTIKKGETFSGKAISQAKMVGIKYLYEIDDPQTSEGFFELPSNVSSEYDGIINIKGREVGIHKIKLRSTHWQNGEKVMFENEFELEVTE